MPTSGGLQASQSIFLYRIWYRVVFKIIINAEERVGGEYHTLQGRI